MTLEALLQLLREGYLNDRSDRISGSSDYLWTDTTLVTYLNEAQRRFATLGFVLRDSTTDEVTKITLEAGRSLYPVHESVFAVMSAKRTQDSADLTRVGHPVLAAYRAPSDSWIDPSAVTALNPGGTIAYSTDEGVNDQLDDSFSQITLRVFPTPALAQEGETLRLRVLRTPIEEFSLSKPQAKPEIPRDHHVQMLDWAAYLALRIVDDDAGSPRRAEEFKKAFEQHVKEARQLVLRKVFAPTQWGFGRGGFSWER